MAKAFAGMLLQLRQENGISQRDAAAAMGISQSLLSHYEKGSREPRLDFLIRAAAYYHVTTDYLLGCSSDRVRPDTRTETISEKHRALLDTLRFIFVHLEQEEDTAFADAAGRYLTLALYKICRTLCINTPAAAELFSADSLYFSDCADAAMKREEVTMKRWAQRNSSHVPLLAGLWLKEPSEQLTHAAITLMHRSEHLMRDCLPFA